MTPRSRNNARAVPVAYEVVACGGAAFVSAEPHSGDRLLAHGVSRGISSPDDDSPARGGTRSAFDARCRRILLPPRPGLGIEWAAIPRVPFVPLEVGRTPPVAKTLRPSGAAWQWHERDLAWKYAQRLARGVAVIGLGGVSSGTRRATASPRPRYWSSSRYAIRQPCSGSVSELSPGSSVRGLSMT